MFIQCRSSVVRRRKLEWDSVTVGFTCDVELCVKLGLNASAKEDLCINRRLSVCLFSEIT